MDSVVYAMGQNQIHTYRETGSRKSYIAGKYKTTEANLHHWLRKRGLQNVKEEY